MIGIAHNLFMAKIN